MNQMSSNFKDIVIPEDLGNFLDLYRGSGIAKIIQQQFLEIYAEDEQFAFSTLGNFLDLLMEYHKEAALSQEIKDDYIYNEIQEMLTKMSKQPEYIEYTSFLDDKVNAMQKADLAKNQDVE